MAMAMIQKARPLVPMNEKPTTATPDYETFQLLFRKADEFIEINSIEPLLCDKLNNTEGIIEGGNKKKPFINKQNELNIFKTVPTRTIIYPKSYTEEIRKIRVRSNKKKKNQYIIGPLPIIPYENWECDIIWDDSNIYQQKKINRGKGGWVYQQNEDETAVATKLRKVINCNNNEIITGKWVNGILWDNDTTFTIDLASDNEYEEDDDNDCDNDDGDYNDIVERNSFNERYGYKFNIVRRKRHLDEDYDYSENIPLVNTAEIIDHYLPHHEEEFIEIETKRREEEEERKRKLMLQPSVQFSQSDSTTTTTTTTSTNNNNSNNNNSNNNNSGDTIVKNSAYRQQQAKEKDERLAKMTAGVLFQSPTITPPPNSTTTELPQNSLAITNKRKKFNASTELEHSSIASRHLNCKVSLKESELKYYHRPRGKGIQAVWNISFDSKKNKNKLTHRRSHVRQHLVNQIRTLSDLTLLEGDFICIEYIEEHPNAIMNPGMASKIINYYRQPPEDKTQSSQPNQDDTINDDGPTTLSSSKTDSIRRIPRHLQHLQQNSSSSDSTNINMIDIPKLPEGITEVLENDDPFPFVGNIEPGAPPQPCLHTNLFRAPLFSQQPKSTDFLLIRNPTNRKNVHFILRPLPALFTCGQQEPLMVVTKTGKKKSLNQLQSNFLNLHITRYFLNQGSLTSDPIVNYHDVAREFEFFFKRYRNDAKRCLARVADDIGDEMWKRKPLSQIIPVEDYEIKFSPEDVCLQERALCSEFQLQELGINQLMEVPKMQQGIQRMNKLEKFRKKVLDTVREEAQLSNRTPKGYRLEILAEILDYHLKKLRHQLEVGRFIYETIQLTPWIITESFIKGYLDKGGDGRFRLRGLGDPSGIGEAFSFLRPTKSSERRQEGIYDTDRDLRKLPTKQLDELLMPWCTAERIKSCPRWDKVALIRRFANIAKKEGRAFELHKFARDEKTTHQSSLGQFKEGCLEIWKTQAKALSTQWKDIDEDLSDEDDDDNDDDDDNFDDLDDLDDDLITGIETKSGTTSQSQGGRGRKKEDEDTKELRSLQTGQFFDGITPNPSSTTPSTTTTTTTTNNNNKTNAPEFAQGEFLLNNNNNKVQWDPPKQVVKRITRRINTDGSEVIEVKFIVSETEVKRVLSQKSNTNTTNNSNQPNNRNRLTNSNYFQNNEDVFEEERTESHSLKLKIGKMKHKADKHVKDTQQRKALQELEESREFERYSRPIRTQKDRISAKRGKIPRNSRLPHVLFASTLEDIIIGIIKRKNAAPFLYPVDTVKFKDYLSIVARPICLLDIRENISKYKYSTVELFLDDLQLMAKNCELFNGSEHALTKEAYLIHTEAIHLINVEREVLGKDKDPYTVQQNDIRIKFNQLKRPLHSTITVPNMMLRTSTDDSFFQSNKTSNQPFIAPPNIDSGFDDFGFSGNPDNDNFDLDFDVNEDTSLFSSTPNLNNNGNDINNNENENNDNDQTKSLTIITPTSFTNTPTPTQLTQSDTTKHTINMEDVFGDDSSSGEEEVLEEGTF